MYFRDLVNTKIWLIKKKVYPQQGQITEKFEIGRWISLLSCLSSVTRIVEIGVWNGKGTSQCILKGAKRRVSMDNLQIFGLEVSGEMIKKARRVIRKESRYSLLWGGVVSSEDENLLVDNLSEIEAKWWTEDKENLDRAPNRLPDLPNDISLLILDGGEFTSYAEFKRLEKRCKGFVVLDDVNARKNFKTHHELMKNSEWVCIAHSDERNGFSIFKSKRVTSSTDYQRELGS